MNLRTLVSAAGLTILALMTAVAQNPPAPPSTPPSTPPAVTGPIRNTTALRDTGHGYPFSATSMDLKKAGFIEEEFFLEGKANRYITSATANATIADSGNAYKTRLVVRRPASPSKFNGTVIVEWTNVSQGHDNEADWFQSADHFMRSGYAWVGVSAQAVGVQALTLWSPDRYGTLTVDGPAPAGRGGGPAGGGRGGARGAPPAPAPPVGARTTGVAFIQRGAPGAGAAPGAPGAGGAGGRGAAAPSPLSFDIFTQAGLAVRGKANITILGGLKVEHVIATGHSQSAQQLGIYFNSVHPLAPVYDAVMLHGGGGTMRTDLNVKIFKVLSETDLTAVTLNEALVRQPDSDRFHEWEVAGASHLDGQLSRGLEGEGLLAAGATPVDGRDAVKPPTISGGGAGIGTANVLSTVPNDGCVRPPLSRIPFHYVLDAAYDHLTTWMKAGKTPPAAPKIEMANGAIVRDADGNAKGGIRLSQHAVPTAVNRGDNTQTPGQAAGQFCFLLGSYEPFSSEKLSTLYPKHDAYVKAVKEITDGNVKAAYILKKDADATIEEATKSRIGGK